jgi:ABC-type transport system substrate-binding protein
MTNRYDRRSFLERGARAAAGGLLVPSAAAALLQACAAGGQEAPPAPVRPRRGGALTFATEAEIPGFNPLANAWDASSLTCVRQVYDPLFVQAADGSIRPHLALSITPNADYTQWTMNLRPGVKFHDGSPMDADAVRINIEAQLKSPLTAPTLFNLETIKALDPLTVLFTMKNPWVPFPFYLTVKPGHIVGLRSLFDISGKTPPIGTGPFMFKEWVPGDHFTAVRNPNYWRPGLPYLDSVTFKPIPDPPARANSLRSGNVDVMHSPDPQNLADFMHDPDYHQINDLHSYLGEPDMIFVMLNTTVPPLDDIRVRQALAYATDRQKYIDTLGNGLTKPSEGPFIQGSPYYAPTGYPGYNPARARALVADYQKEKGPISFKFGNVATARYRQENELLQAMWKAVGINTDIVLVEQAPYIFNAIVGDYQAYGWRQFNSPDPDANYTWWSIGTVAPVGKQALNFARFKDLQVEAGLQAGRTQVDPIVRTAAYKLVAERLAAVVPYIWLTQVAWIVGGRRSVGGIGQATLPDGGKARDMISGVMSLAEIWMSS